MSFILDALRKSENERQRNRAPGIADMRTPQKKSRRSVWLPLVALLAGLNLALLAVLWFAGTTDPGNTAAGPETAAARPVPAPPATINRNLSAELPEPADEPARLASITPPAPAPADSTAADSRSTRMLTVTEAMLDGSLSIAPLSLELHVYDANPAKRFVYINTSRYGEGERISEGPTVTTINEQGVILSYQGRDYLLSRE